MRKPSTIQNLFIFIVLSLSITGCELQRNQNIHEACEIVNEIGYVWRSSDGKGNASPQDLTRMRDAAQLIDDEIKNGHIVETNPLRLISGSMRSGSTYHAYSFCNGEETYSLDKTLFDYPKESTPLGLILNLWPLPIFIALLFFSYNSLRKLRNRNMKIWNRMRKEKSKENLQSFKIIRED